MTGAVLFFHCYAGPHFSATHPSWLREAEHWKVGEYNANWGTGELSMRSPSTFLQERKEMCHSVMKLELNCSERKTMSWCKCLISTPQLDSMTCLCGRKHTNTRKGFKKLTSSFTTLIQDGGVASIC